MGVFERLCPYWIDQQRNIIETIATKQDKPKHSTKVPPFLTVKGLVHEKALLLMVEEKNKLPKDRTAPDLKETCRCKIHYAYGLPCFHKIWKRMQPGSTGTSGLQAVDIHPHWWIIRPKRGTSSHIVTPVPKELQDPRVVRGKGRPRGSLGGGLQSRGLGRGRGRGRGQGRGQEAPNPASSGVLGKYI